MSPSAPRGSHVPIPQIWVLYSTKSRLHAQVSHPELVPASDKDKSPKMGFGGTVLLPDPITAGGLGQAGAHPTGSNTPIPVLQCSEGLGLRFSCISSSDAEEESRRIYPRQCTHPPSTHCVLVHGHPKTQPYPHSSILPPTTSPRPPEGTAHTLLLFLTKIHLFVTKHKALGVPREPPLPEPPRGSSPVVPQFPLPASRAFQQGIPKASQALG